MEEISKPPILIVENTGQVFPLGEELITIGRKTGNTIVLSNDLKASRHHATITWEDGTYILRDLGSSNGTIVNDKQVSEPQELKNNDVIQVGDTVFRISLPLGETIVSMPPPTEPSMDDAPPAARQESEVILTNITPLPIPDNPYVGPRTFTQQEATRFFGRELEARELHSLIVSQRMVLFYAQSGAGKSSLINTRIIPQLREANFPVLPIGRVSGKLPEGIDEVDNIYIFNLLLSLDESDGDPTRFIQMKLTEFLKNLTSMDGQHYYYDDSAVEEIFETNEIHEDEVYYEESPYVLIIDQFEEVVTNHPHRWEDRENFFQQLAEAMANDPYLWVVLTLREDYIAPLDPYMHLLPDKMRARFYMQRMKYEAALEAVKKPAEQYGRPFAPGVAENLVNNLRQIRTYSAEVPDKIKTELGEFIEPVQLQVVCYQLWENLKDRPPGAITQQDLTDLADIDLALGQFYEQAVHNVVEKTNVTEIELRSWFERELITEAGTKGTVYRGMAQTGGIDNEAVDLLANSFILRSEAKAGGTWYELVHDRFVNPILYSNNAWRLEQPLLQMAQSWIDSDRSETKLLEGQQLSISTETNWHHLGTEVEEFVEASLQAQRIKDEIHRQQELEQAQTLLEEQRKRVEEERKRAELEAETTAKLRQRAWWLGMLFSISVLMAGIAAFSGCQAREQSANAQIKADEAQAAEATAVQAGATAIAALDEANTERAKAISAQQTAEAQATAAAVNAEAAREILQEQVESEAAMAAQVVDAAATETARDTKAISLDATSTALALVDQSLRATGTAQAVATETAVAATATQTYLEELLAPTATAIPQGVDTPTPTSTSSPTPTATPDVAPTETAVAVATQQAEVRIAEEVLAEEVAAAEAPVGCSIQPEGSFVETWNNHRDELGCPLSAKPISGSFAEQEFERGFMWWSQILGQFFVTIDPVNEEAEPEWLSFTEDNLRSAGHTDQCEPSIPKSDEDLVKPISGFGAIWCSSPELQRAVGYGLENEYAVPNDQVQRFENGYVIKDTEGNIFVLYGGLEEGVYELAN